MSLAFWTQAQLGVWCGLGSTAAPWPGLGRAHLQEKREDATPPFGVFWPLLHPVVSIPFQFPLPILT
jgi:hypothetical protein